jgi:hypothetical protein
MPEPSTNFKLKVLYQGQKVTCESCALLRKSTFVRSSSGNPPFVATICLKTRELVPNGFVCRGFRPREVPALAKFVVPEKPWPHGITIGCNCNDPACAGNGM